MLRLPADQRERLAALLRLQASDNDGERANASAAIARLLQRYGIDWHDLTEALLADPTPAPELPSSSTWKRSQGPIDLPRTQLLELLITVGWYHTISFVANAARVPLEPWAARFP